MVRQGLGSRPEGFEKGLWRQGSQKKAICLKGGIREEEQGWSNGSGAGALWLYAGMLSLALAGVLMTGF